MHVSPSRCLSCPPPYCGCTLFPDILQHSSLSPISAAVSLRSFRFPQHQLLWPLPTTIPRLCSSWPQQEGQSAWSAQLPFLAHVSLRTGPICLPPTLGPAHKRVPAVCRGGNSWGLGSGQGFPVFCFHFSTINHDSKSSPVQGRDHQQQHLGCHFHYLLHYNWYVRGSLE